ncbi:hypothetical protein ABN239_04570, partial [Providencia vermicola]|uniref:hypothetical protein n=1 Tax=Providencia vermicola TaxID=333965 RepID=UPI0032DB89E7
AYLWHKLFWILLVILFCTTRLQASLTRPSHRLMYAPRDLIACRLLVAQTILDTACYLILHHNVVGFTHSP